MKRFAKILMLTVALAAMLAVSAFAADFTHCADALNELGLFQGSGNGYELDRAPTRAEAAIMLVRLLGQEEAARQLEYTAPFTDVGDWAKPHVQYLYENGLALGQSDTLFGAASLCTAQQYSTFLLRALGYSDSEGDFTYAGALDYAAELGLIDGLNCDPDNFLRDHVAAMSYTALSTAPKSGEADLLTKLVEDGAIADAKGYDEKFQLYRDYLAANEAYAGANAMAMDMTMDMRINLAGIELAGIDMTGSAAAEMDLEQMDMSRMALDMDMTISMDPTMAGVSEEEASSTISAGYYYADGWFYMDMEGSKVKMALSFDDVLAQMDTAKTGSSIAQLKDITATTAGGATTYRVVLATDAINSVVNDVMASLGGAEGLQMSIGDTAMDMTVQNGAVTAMAMDMTLEMSAEGMAMELVMNAVMDNIRTDGVVIEAPADLDAYEDLMAAMGDLGIIGGADGPTDIIVG